LVLADQQRKTYIATKGYAFLWYLPIVAILAITPLIVYLSVRPVPGAFRRFWIADINFDFFFILQNALVSFLVSRTFAFFFVLSIQKERRVSEFCSENEIFLDGLDRFYFFNFAQCCAFTCSTDCLGGNV
jgi:hypothetical protein